MKKIVIDLDDTITIGDSSDSYAEKLPRTDVIETLRRYQQDGFTISIFTSRNMRTHKGNVGLINVHTLPIIHEWLNKHDVPFDEIIVGKPWCGFEGFYVDDKAIRPAEFASMSYAEIRAMLANK
jgi:capsule biosynthesis phosphatase